MKVEITDYAKSELRKIHNYHVQVASPKSQQSSLIKS